MAIMDREKSFCLNMNRNTKNTMMLTGVFYLLFVGLLTLFFGWLEKKLNYYKG